MRDAIADNGEAESLSWEQRKQLILQQMEQESFDAESFVANLPHCHEDGETPELFVERLIDEMESRQREVQEFIVFSIEQSQTGDGQLADWRRRDRRDCRQR